MTLPVASVTFNATFSGNTFQAVSASAGLIDDLVLDVRISVSISADVKLKDVQAQLGGDEDLEFDIKVVFVPLVIASALDVNDTLTEDDVQLDEAFSAATSFAQQLLEEQEAVEVSVHICTHTYLRERESACGEIDVSADTQPCTASPRLPR